MPKSLLARKIAELKELLKDKDSPLIKNDIEGRIQEYTLLFEQEEAGELLGKVKFTFTRGDSLLVTKDEAELFNSDTSTNPASWVQSTITKTYRERGESSENIRKLIGQCFLRDNASAQLSSVADGLQLRLVDKDSREHFFSFSNGKLQHCSVKGGKWSDKKPVDKKLMDELEKEIKLNNFELDVPVNNLGNVELIKYKFINGVLCSSLVSKGGASDLKHTHKNYKKQATEFTPPSSCFFKILKKTLLNSLGEEAQLPPTSPRSPEVAPPDSSNGGRAKQDPKTLEEKLKNIEGGVGSEARRPISLTSRDFLSDSGGRVDSANNERIGYVDDASSKLKIKSRPIITQEIKGKAMYLELAGVVLDGNKYSYFDDTTDLFEGNIRGSTISNVDFSKVRNLDTVMFTNCKFGSGCIFPENFVFKSSNIRGDVTRQSLKEYENNGLISFEPDVSPRQNLSGTKLAIDRIRAATSSSSTVV
jgi:hypothetical protein